MASGEEPSGSLKCKTWVLKVSIHCEGCKKKVKKILRSIQGVYDSEFDAKQHKVTIKASVDSETIIRKLEKSGKHAVLWPDEKPSIDQNPNKGGAGSGKEDKETSSAKEPSEKPIISSEASPVATSTVAKPSDSDKAEKAKAPTLAELPIPSTKPEEAEAKSSTEPPNHNAKTDESDSKVAQIPGADKGDISSLQPVKSKAGAAPPAVAESKEKASAGGDIVDGGEKKPAKVRKNRRGNAETSLNCINSNPQPPPHHVRSYPANPPPLPPEYVMSYNMAQPTISSAYYAPMPSASQDHLYAPYTPLEVYYGSVDPTSSPAPPMPSAWQDHLYVPYSPPELYYRSMDPTSWPAPVLQPPQPPGIFSEENPNACYIM